jgi:serine-type D-Ala-D-Ala carboxypeptidase (penicillin-binding protein 5/6)
MGTFSCRRVLSVVMFVFLVASPAGAQKHVKKSVKGVSLRSVHKFAPELREGTEKQESAVTVSAHVPAQELKKEEKEAEPGAVTAELLGKLSCRSAYVMDAKTGKALYDRSADQPGQPASTIKILTGLIAVESLNGKEMVPTSAYAANMPASKIYLKKGASYRASDLINAVLLASANDASVALAEKLAGSESAFARLMTKKAEALGAQSTICKSANGLTRPGQQTTARDLAVVFNRAMNNPDFAERMSAVKLRNSDGRLVKSHNRALWTLDGAVGGKTGYTAAAGKTYVGKFQRGSQVIIVSLLGSAFMWQDIALLVEHGFAQQEMASRAQDDGSDGVMISKIKEQNRAQESVDYAMFAMQQEENTLQE